MKQIRFAPIPKCASRSLSALGLLGEVYGRCHTKITEYPEFELYDWHYIERDNIEWYKSWWLQSQSNTSFARALGMRFADFNADMLCFNNIETIGDYTPDTGPDEWLPHDKEELKSGIRPFIANGQGFKEYCYASIMDGILCTPVHINGLDAFLVANGFRPVHKNVRQYHDFGIINEPVN